MSWPLNEEAGHTLQDQRPHCCSVMDGVKHRKNLATSVYCDSHVLHDVFWRCLSWWKYKHFACLYYFSCNSKSLCFWFIIWNPLRSSRCVLTEATNPSRLHATPRWFSLRNTRSRGCSQCGMCAHKTNWEHGCDMWLVFPVKGQICLNNGACH